MKSRMVRFVCILVLILSATPLQPQSIVDSLISTLDGAGKKQQIDILNKIAFERIYLNPASAVDDVRIAYRMAEALKYPPGRASALNVMGGIHWAVGDYDQALSHYLKAVEIYEELEDGSGLSKVFNNIGETYKKIEEWDKSLSYLQKSLEIKEESGTPSSSFLTYNNIAEIYVQTGELDKAESFYNLIINNLDKASDRGAAYAYTGMGKIALERGEFDKAISYLEKSLARREKINETRGIADTKITMGKVFQEKNNLTHSLELYHQALLLSNKIQAVDIQARAVHGIYQIDSIKNDYQSALANYRKYIKLRSRLFDEEQTMNISRLQVQYETEMLQRENTGNKLLVKQKNFIVIIAITALIIVAIMAAAFYKQRAAQVNANQLLAEKNHKIEAQSEQLVSLNTSLEQKIEKRTTKLKQQNEVLANYAFVTAHELRAPVANILGLANLLKRTAVTEKEAEIIEHLEYATNQLDTITKELSRKLDKNVEEID